MQRANGIVPVVFVEIRHPPAGRGGLSMDRGNGIAPVVFVEIRHRPWWRRRLPVLRLTSTTVVILALLTVALMLLDRRVPLALSLAPWAVIACQLVVWPGGRPCDGCGRWLRHRLDCQGRAAG